MPDQSGKMQNKNKSASKTFLTRIHIQIMNIEIICYFLRECLRIIEWKEIKWNSWKRVLSIFKM